MKRLEDFKNIVDIINSSTINYLQNFRQRMLQKIESEEITVLPSDKWEVGHTLEFLKSDAFLPIATISFIDMRAIYNDADELLLLDNGTDLYMEYKGRFEWYSLLVPAKM